LHDAFGLMDLDRFEMVLPIPYFKEKSKPNMNS
jgi:hypothetical protein